MEMWREPGAWKANDWASLRADGDIIATSLSRSWRLDLWIYVYTVLPNFLFVTLRSENGNDRHSCQLERKVEQRGRTPGQK